MNLRRNTVAASLAVAFTSLSMIAIPAWGQGAAPAAAPDGAAVYDSAGCSGCHGANGEGGVGPALAGNLNLRDGTAVIGQIVSGGEVMPAFVDILDSDQIAAVATYVRNSWGNDFGEVTAADVASYRQQ